MKKLIAVVALLFVFGCASGPSPAVRHQGQVELANRLMVGRPYQEFVAMLGPPQSGMDDGSGGKIYSWHKRNTRVVPGDTTTWSTPGTCQPLQSYSTTGGYQTHGGTYTPGTTYSTTGDTRVTSKEEVFSLWVVRRASSTACLTLSGEAGIAGC